MPFETFRPSRGLAPKTLFLTFFAVWFLGQVVWWNNPHSLFEQKRIHTLPFGFVWSPEGGVEVQDFAYNLVFFRGIWDHSVPRPYRMEDQEKLVRHSLPGMTSGMCHAYSPVGLILVWPLLQVSGAMANFLYDLLAALGIIICFYVYLLPRTTSLTQLCSLGICSVSICIMLAFGLGQSSLLTTTLLTAFWMGLQHSSRERSLAKDLFLALLFWALCLKPSVAILPFALLLGTKAWRPLLLGFFLLGVTWLVLAPLYGGWWTGLQDYAYLLNHYNNSDFIPFMRRDYVPGHDAETRGLFALDRVTTEILTLVFIALHWFRKISLSELFQALIGIFLLFSPYLLPSEDWILCLLVVEGEFFRNSSRLAAVAKLLILFGIMDLRGGTIIPWSITFPLMCVLFGWIFLDALGKRIRPDASRTNLPPAYS